MRFPTLEPNLQMSFSYKLQSIRSLFLHEAFSGRLAGWRSLASTET